VDNLVDRGRKQLDRRVQIDDSGKYRRSTALDTLTGSFARYKFVAYLLTY